MERDTATKAAAYFVEDAQSIAGEVMAVIAGGHLTWAYQPISGWPRVLKELFARGARM
jgi:hypothetical protein